MYHSIVIQESLVRPEVLEKYKIIKTKFSDTQNWHLHIIEIKEPLDEAIAEIQRAMLSNVPYYFHVYDEGEILVVVFNDKKFSLDPNNELTWNEARKYGGEKLHIPPEQLDFYPTRISDEDVWYSR